MKYKIGIHITLVISLLFAFRAEVQTTPRKALLQQLDSLEMEIQQLRRAGKSIDKIEEEISRLKWTIEESQNDTTKVTDSLAASIVIEEPVKDTVTQEVKSGLFDKAKSFFKTRSTLDIMIIVMGWVAVLSIILLLFFLLYFFVTKKRKPKNVVQSNSKKDSKPAKPLKKLVAKPKKELSQAEKKATLEDIKSKLSALNSRSDKVVFNNTPAQETGQERSIQQDDSFENPFRNRQEIPAEYSPMTPFEDEQSSVEKIKSPSVPSISASVEPQLSADQTLLEERLEHQREESLQSQQKIEDVEEQYLSINDSIVAAFDTGEDVVSIAKRMSMSIDQIKMILRIAGR